jgi:glycosyltransferase involved in cell wall biosynthesis
MAGRVAFCTVPHIGGLFSVYQRLRKALSASGWEVLAVHIDSEKADWYGYEARLADEGCVELAGRNGDLKGNARTFVDWVSAEGIDIVLPMSSRACLSAVPHLPEQVHVITRCINVTPHAYRLVTAHPARTAAVVVTSPRQRDDLRRCYGLSSDQLHLIPNAIDIDTFHCRDRLASATRPLRLGVLDRLEDLQKGVFSVPRILHRLDEAGVSWHLQIVGGGPDESELRRRLAFWTDQGKVHFAGPLPQSEIPGCVKQFDILLKPSKNEGFPSSLIECMAAGAVPVCSRIRGVTDWIVEHERSGMLCPINGPACFAASVVALDRDRDKLARLSRQAASDAARRFDLQRFSDGWTRLFNEVYRSARPALRAASWEAFRLASPWRPHVMNRVLYQWLPRRFKDSVRTEIERLRARTKAHSEDTPVNAAHRGR